MKKFAGLLLWLLIPASALAQEITMKEVISSPGNFRMRYFYRNDLEIAYRVIDADFNTTEAVGEIPDGIVRQLTNDGQAYWIYSYQDGEVAGLAKLYDENGSLLEEVNYEDGKPEGVSISYYPNGKLRERKTYKEAKLDGVSLQYSQDARLEAEITYKNGLKVSEKIYAKFKKGAN